MPACFKSADKPVDLNRRFFYFDIFVFEGIPEGVVLLFCTQYIVRSSEYET